LNDDARCLITNFLLAHTENPESTWRISGAQQRILSIGIDSLVFALWFTSLSTTELFQVAAGTISTRNGTPFLDPFPILSAAAEIAPDSPYQYLDWAHRSLGPVSRKRVASLRTLSKNCRALCSFGVIAG